MISIYNLKPKFQQLLMPVLNFLYKAGISANQITIGSVILSVLIGMSFWYADTNRFLFLALPVGLFVRMALNALDGMMARTFQQQSRTGEVLNELGDVASDFFIYFPLLKFEGNALYPIVIFLCLSVMNEFAGLLAKIIGGQRRYDGPMGKSDRAFLIGLYGLVSFFHINISAYFVHIFSLVNLLLIISTLLRVKRSLNHG